MPNRVRSSPQMARKRKARCCCCCLPGCTCAVFWRFVIFILLSSFVLAYAVKAVWIRAEWPHQHRTPVNGTTEPFSWSAALQNENFFKWERRYYAPAYGYSVVFLSIMCFVTWYIIGTCASCGRAGCSRLRKWCISPCDRDTERCPTVESSRRPVSSQYGRLKESKDAAMQSMSDVTGRDYTSS